MGAMQAVRNDIPSYERVFHKKRQRRKQVKISDSPWKWILSNSELHFLTLFQAGEREFGCKFEQDDGPNYVSILANKKRDKKGKHATWKQWFSVKVNEDSHTLMISTSGHLTLFIRRRQKCAIDNENKLTRSPKQQWNVPMISSSSWMFIEKTCIQMYIHVDKTDQERKRKDRNEDSQRKEWRREKNSLQIIPFYSYCSSVPNHRRKTEKKKLQRYIEWVQRKNRRNRKKTYIMHHALEFNQ